MTVLARVRDLEEKFFGVVEAIVEDVVDPDKEGRIKVSFPWFHDQMITEWCRVRQLYAGPGYGTFFVPEAKDEVLVAFIHGDMRLPIILGGLYNGKDKPPSHRAADRDEKMIRTKKGHEILLDDTDGKHRVRVATSGGHTVDLDDAGHAITVQTSGGRRMVLDDAAMRITIDTGTGTTITLDAAGQLQLTAVAQVQVTAPAVSLTGATVNISGGVVTLAAGMVELGPPGGGPPSGVVLGDKLKAIFNSHTHPIVGSNTGTPTQPFDDSAISTSVVTG